MCGRFTLHTATDLLQAQFGLTAMPDLPPHYNIAPSQDVAAVRAGERGRECVLLHWGLIPAWAKEERTRYSLINARAETVADKPAYRSAFRARRCLVLADGFYEWQARADGKQPYYIRLRDGTPFGMAGLWERWEGDGKVIESCSIIVTEANDLMRPIHDRMPVIIRPGHYARWLDPDPHGGAELQSLLAPYAADAMQANPVSKRVNRPVNDDPACIAEDAQAR